MVTHKIKMDLCGQGEPQWIRAVQGDAWGRSLEFSLYERTQPWQIPGDLSVLVRHQKKKNGKFETVSQYDALPDGTPAWSAQDNVLTLQLAPGVFQEAGNVRLLACMLQGDRILHTIPLEIEVAENAEPGQNARSGNNEGYCYVTAFLPAPGSARPGQHIRITGVDGNGKVTAVEAVDLSQSGDTGGAVDDATIQSMVESYLKANPPKVTESDPTVPAWAKQASKPAYTAAEVGALAASTKIPARPEDIGAQPEGDYALRSEIPSVPVQSVNGKTGAVLLTAADVGALPSDTVIPEAVTDAHINSLIDAKLAAIPNAAEVAY